MEGSFLESWYDRIDKRPYEHFGLEHFMSHPIVMAYFAAEKELQPQPDLRSLKHKLALVVTNLETIQESLLHPPTLNERSIQLEIVTELIHMVKELQA